MEQIDAPRAPKEVRRQPLRWRDATVGSAMMTFRIALALAIVLTAALSAVGGAAPEPVPLGHPDFYPSDDRPVGFCGDGNAYFPGATPVAEFWDGTPVKVNRDWRDRRWKEPKKIDHWDFKDNEPKNIVWKTEMPSWANTQPTVVGDRVFTYAEPYTLVCCDARTGGILWTVEANPWACAGLDPKVAATCDALHDVWRALPFLPAMLKGSTVYRRVPVKEWNQILPLLEKQVVPRVLAELEKVDPGPGWGPAAEQMMAAVKDHVRQLEAAADETASKHVKPDEKKINALLDLIDRRIQDLSDMRRDGRVPLVLSWGHMVGACMNAPVSDGRHVYASFAYGQTVRVDLNGKVVWRRWFPNAAQNRTQCQSGLLCGDIYVDVHGGSQVLRGLDKRTGKTVWETPTKNASVKGGSGGYYVGSHKVVRLENGGTGLDVVVTTLCNLIRARDGREVGYLPWEEDRGPSGGPSIFNVGNIVFKAANGDNLSLPLRACRLALVDKDTVKAEKIWTGDRRCSPGYNSQVATPDFLVLTTGWKGNPPNIMNPVTGAVIRAAPKDQNYGELSNIVAGKTFFWAEAGCSHSIWNGLLSAWGGRRADGKSLAMFHSVDLSDPASPKVLSHKNLLGGTDWPRQPAMERLAPELYALDCYAGQAYGRVCHRLHTDTGIFASGNRLFIRTTSHLYCIGDPKVEYDWNPASRPRDVAASLK